MSLFNKISSESVHLNQTEKKILDEILANYQNFERVKISMLAEKLFISSTAIIRLCKKLGYSGFSELKYQIKLDNSSVDFDGYNYEQELLSIMNQTVKLNSSESIKQCAELIYESDHVVFFALGLSKLVALALSKRLSCLNKFAIVPDDRDSCVSYANNLKPNQLAVFISLSGNTDIIKKIAYITKTKNVPIITFTGLSQSTLIAQSTVSLLAYHSSLNFVPDDINSRLGLSILCEMVFNEYLKIDNKHRSAI